MKYNYNNKEFNVIIKRKRIKNTYIRIKDNNTIYVSTNYLSTKGYIKKLIDNNIQSILRMFDKNVDKTNYFLGKKYNIIYNNKDKITDDIIYTLNDKTLSKLYRKTAEEVFKERLDYNYSLFSENIPYPILKIRTMKTRWGVCNRKLNKVTLNYNLIHYDIELIDYVIIHELSHFIEFNHSKNFWNVVAKYCDNYKECRKKLKE